MIIILIIGILIGSPITIILALFSMFTSSVSDEFEYSERQRERRHQELMEIEKERLRLEKNRRSEVSKRCERIVLRDERGRFVAREVIEEFDDEDNLDE